MFSLLFKVRVDDLLLRFDSAANPGISGLLGDENLSSSPHF